MHTDNIFYVLVVFFTPLIVDEQVVLYVIIPEIIISIIRQNSFTSLVSTDDSSELLN